MTILSYFLVKNFVSITFPSTKLIDLIFTSAKLYDMTVDVAIGV